MKRIVLVLALLSLGQTQASTSVEPEEIPLTEATSTSDGPAFARDMNRCGQIVAAAEMLDIPPFMILALACSEALLKHTTQEAQEEDLDAQSDTQPL